MKRLLLLAALLLVPCFLSADTTSRYLVATKHPFAGRIGPLVNDADGITVGERNVEAYHIVNGFAADLTDDEAAELAKSPEVKMVYKPAERHALGLVAAPERDPNVQTTPYGISLVNAPAAWAAGRGEGINVAVLDTGIDLNHPELKSIIAGGFNEILKNDNFQDDNEHGTHCSGIIAAADNSIGVVGVAPKVKLWGVKVLNSKGSGRGDQIIAGIQWVVDKKKAVGGNWVISMSLGSSQSDTLEQTAIESAIDAGIIVVAASGNESTAGTPAPVGFPAGYDRVIAVGAVDATSTIADFSNQGPEVSLAAPGVDVLSTLPVGSGALSFVQRNGAFTDAVALTGSKLGTVTGTFIDCGLGKTGQFPASVAGNIALIKRGDITFNEKTKNAVAAGATGVVIYNKDTSALAFTLIGQNCDSTGNNCVDNPADVNFNWPVTIAISLADGTALQALSGSSITITNQKDDYGLLSGTSMACPHVSGAAALVWSLAPNATADQVKTALFNTAKDLGAAGKDPVYGYGLVDVFAAGKALAPEKFVPAVPPGRRILKRGH